jgi:uncharacterized membrane protein
MTAAIRPVPAPHRINQAALWFGVFGAPAAWTVQELVGYAVVAHACYPSGEPLLHVPMPNLSTIDLAVSLVTLLTGVAAAVVAYRAWERSHDDRTRFMALSGVIVGLIFLFSIIMNVMVLFIQPACS